MKKKESAHEKYLHEAAAGRRYNASPEHRAHERDAMKDHHPAPHLARERDQHMERVHHEKAMLDSHTRGIYEHEEDRPAQPREAADSRGMGLGDEFFRQADPIAYGQAGSDGCRADDRRIESQFKDYHWD